jgi:predicted DsbA family dithiol-disulfide isomerase
VKAVPTFVFDGQYMVEGGQPASTFLQVLEEVQRLGAAESSAALGSDDAAACDDGVCAVPNA